MPVQSHLDSQNSDFASLSEAMRSLLFAAGPQNIEAVRDDILRKVAESAAIARKSRAAAYAENPSAETLAD
ncbi:MAG: hypothetical protein RR380_09625 [Gordonibacter sp.]